MAISSQLVGRLGGAPEVIESRGWFSNGNRQLRYLDKTWAVARGRYLVAVNGSIAPVYTGTTVARDSAVIVNGVTVWTWNNTGSVPSTTDARPTIGGYAIVDDVTSIVMTGVGQVPLAADPYVVIVKLD